MLVPRDLKIHKNLNSIFFYCYFFFFERIVQTSLMRVALIVSYCLYCLLTITSKIIINIEQRCISREENN